MKVNIDGSFQENPGHAGIDEVGQDNAREVQFIFSIYKGFQTNNYMEALAILYVVEQCCILGWPRIICESDSRVVVTLLNEHQLDNANWHQALVIRHILRLCGSLESITFIHIPWEWNEVVDCLAK